MKQPVHICMKDNRLVYRSGNFQSVPKVSHCPDPQDVGQWDRTGR
ncbi:hypothetical protein NXV47_07810 [Bacteroides uniformis]|nr:hypothetical protein [Bacteroides uniformis]